MNINKMTKARLIELILNNSKSSEILKRDIVGYKNDADRLREELKDLTVDHDLHHSRAEGLKDEVTNQRLIIKDLKEELSIYLDYDIELSKAKNTVELQEHEMTRQRHVIGVQEQTIKKLFDTVFKLSSAIDNLIEDK